MKYKGVKCTSFYSPEIEDGNTVCINYSPVNAAKKYTEISLHLRHSLDFEHRITYYDPQVNEKHKRDLESIKRRIETWESIFL